MAAPIWYLSFNRHTMKLILFRLRRCGGSAKARPAWEGWGRLAPEVKWIGSDQKRFDELFDLFLNDEYRVVQWAGWPLSYAVEEHPTFIKKHFGRLLKNSFFVWTLF